ncbi:hypothetical protein T492DRAFT_954316 [Pavlovales sp. CCMP2436]|nr:hypothetical protein T492DRAFT_954316 [Pavlovales sp. CCMP2436]
MPGHLQQLLSISVHHRTHTDEEGHGGSEAGAGVGSEAEDIEMSAQPQPQLEPEPGVEAGAGAEAYIEMSTQPQPFPCDAPGCGFNSRSADALAKHMKRHHSELYALSRLSHVCDEPGCSYKARTARELEVHTEVHTDAHRGEQTFSCDAPGCGYITTRVDGTLERHKRRRHYFHKTELQPLPPDAVRRRRPPQTASGECDEPGCRAAVCNGLSHYQFLDVLASEFCTPIGGALTAGAGASKDGAASPIVQDLATRTQRPAGKRQLPLDAEHRPPAPGCEYISPTTSPLGNFDEEAQHLAVGMLRGRLDMLH